LSSIGNCEIVSSLTIAPYAFDNFALKKPLISTFCKKGNTGLNCFDIFMQKRNLPLGLRSDILQTSKNKKKTDYRQNYKKRIFTLKIEYRIIGFGDSQTSSTVPELRHSVCFVLFERVFI